ncbi:hypothetical protein [Cryptosporangium arvum]|uniref:Uncharacterized protein n=1 Tax=Cryptosporangium arvum DSM 44712 TaxID=927661 RepID=A0A010YXF8_9ACTN|nr:hypothetical protein [Cryptosporangium arvum]EXG79863.1 hypothetical protein CryarDRAFT_0913 [Cryptosporangium arvum DSM 44712]
MSQPDSSAPSQMPVPTAILLPRPATDPGPEASLPPRPGGWSSSTVGALVAVYTRLGDRVAVVDPNLSGTVTPVTELLGRRTAVLPMREFTPSAGRRTRLVLARLPEPGVPAGSALGEWMHRVARSLTERGYLAVTVDPFGAYPAQRERSGEPGRARYRDHTTSVIAAARAAGLRYQQHLIALHTTVLEPDTRERSGPGAPDASDSGGRRAPVHERLHTDIFVFAAHVAAIPARPQTTAHRQEMRHG